jgi:hypothetical protein
VLGCLRAGRSGALPSMQGLWACNVGLGAGSRARCRRQQHNERAHPARARWYSSGFRATARPTAPPSRTRRDPPCTPGRQGDPPDAVQAQEGARVQGLRPAPPHRRAGEASRPGWYHKAVQQRPPPRGAACAHALRNARACGAAAAAAVEHTQIRTCSSAQVLSHAHHQPHTATPTNR